VKVPLGGIRARRLFSNLDDSVDAVLIVNSRSPFLDDNFRYLTDIVGGVFESSMAVATPTGITVITSEMEGDIARKSGCKVKVAGSRDDMTDLLRSALRGRKVVGVNMAGISHSTMKWTRRSLKGVKLKDVSGDLGKARMIKGEEEIARIKKACSIASKVAKEIPGMLSIGMTEKSAAAEVDYMLRSYGADGPAFETIVAFGRNSALPHHRPGNSRLRRGSIALFDFGASHMNYKSDMTRTLFSKPLNCGMAKIYDIVAEAQQTAIRKIKPGIRAKDVDIAARDVIKDAGYSKFFIHSTGHGLGISEHDPGIIAEKSKDILKERMVLTVEPGIYLPGKGGVRIEDDILVTEKAGLPLTRTVKDLIAI
jgi:Xaa-Pro dipeptidase